MDDGTKNKPHRYILQPDRLYPPRPFKQGGDFNIMYS